MRVFGGIDESGRMREFGVKKIALYSVCLSVLMVVLSILQTSDIKLFGQVADALLAFVCSVGFVFGGGFGAIFGLVSGIVIEFLGGADFTLTPILYVLCGFSCGAFKNKILSSNFASFLIFGAIGGIVREIFTLVYFGLGSTEFDFGLILKDVIIGEYFAYLLCILPLYFVILGIYLLFKGKDEGSRIVK